jgi:hypothetical protein
VLQRAAIQILLQDGQGMGAVVHKYGRLSATAECFDPQGSGSCKQIKNVGAYELAPQNVEQSFPDAVGRGPYLRTFECLQLAPPEPAADDAHG